MTDALDPDRVALTLAGIASRAGAAILTIDPDAPGASDKGDGSPLTLADLAADRVILADLAEAFPGIPVLSEESAGDAIRPDGTTTFFCVDPLDGTREYIARNGQYTVNIALIRAGVPVAGTVYAPAIRALYWGGTRAFRAEVTPGDPVADGAAVPINVRPCSGSGPLAVAVSRSHLDAETSRFLERIVVGERVEIGSSLKFCLIAEGKVDVYPRFGPTMEWDVAAGHAVLAAAGGTVRQPDGAPFVYGNAVSEYRNGPFIAWGGAAHGTT
jgi:3'(2'), 5'-bisphosphate nucleotidase